MAELKLYADSASPFSRAVILFLRATGIEHEYIYTNIRTGQTRGPEYTKINPIQRVPCIDEDGFKLRESVTIMRYLATTRNVADHWYPKDPRKRAVIDSMLDWIPLNITASWVPLLVSQVIAKVPGTREMMQAETDEKLEEKCEKKLKEALDLVESVFLRGPGKFLENGDGVSIADIVLVCQLTQLQFLDTETQKDLLGSRQKIRAWMDAVMDATNPHFDESHVDMYAVGKELEAAINMAHV